MGVGLRQGRLGVCRVGFVSRVARRRAMQAGAGRGHAGRGDRDIPVVVDRKSLRAGCEGRAL